MSDNPKTLLKRAELLASNSKDRSLTTAAPHPLDLRPPHASIASHNRPSSSSPFPSSQAEESPRGFAPLLHDSSRLNWWQTLENNWCFHFDHWFLNLSYVVLSSKVVRIVASNPSLVIGMVASTLVCFVYPALGLFLLLLSHAVCCHNALSSFLMASFRSHIQTKELRGSGNEQLNIRGSLYPSITVKQASNQACSSEAK
nr:GPI inositol-deacylase A isoform X1 [Ipomoea batatas]